MAAVKREEKIQILARELMNIKTDIETGKELFRRTESAAVHLGRAIRLLATPNSTSQKASNT